MTYEFYFDEYHSRFEKACSELFISASSLGRLDVVKWLYENVNTTSALDKSIDIHDYDELAFFNSCRYGHLKQQNGFIQLVKEKMKHQLTSI